MKRAVLLLLAHVAACSAPPITMPTECSVDDDCQAVADCRSYACQAGECVFSFMNGWPSSCGPFQSCTMDDDCYGIGPCVAGMCGCNTDDDCGSTDCVRTRCDVNKHACVQSVFLGVNCPPSR